MHIIKLNATDSTNSFLRKLSAEEIIEDYTVVRADSQTDGRGQLGTIWDSQTSKNLTFSVYRDLTKMQLESPFLISIVTSLAMVKALKQFSVPKLYVKWPNDILSEGKKICGVLIENVIKQNEIKASIIGIGLNVNQTQFDNLPQASSLRLISGNVFNLDEILNSILKYLKVYFEYLEKGEFDLLKRKYEKHLFRKNKPSTFRGTDGALFSGYIKGILDTGSLQVLVEDNIIKEFDFKEVSLLY